MGQLGYVGGPTGIRWWANWDTLVGQLGYVGGPTGIRWCRLRFVGADFNEVGGG